MCFAPSQPCDIIAIGSTGILTYSLDKRRMDCHKGSQPKIKIMASSCSLHHLECRVNQQDIDLKTREAIWVVEGQSCEIWQELTLTNISQRAMLVYSHCAGIYEGSQAHWHIINRFSCTTPHFGKRQPSTMGFIACMEEAKNPSLFVLSGTVGQRSNYCASSSLPPWRDLEGRNEHHLFYFQSNQIGVSWFEIVWRLW